jgi:pimeloyl-ACP methyl ester carboxylesterase
MNHTALAATALTILAFCGGCWNPPGPTARQVERGLVWMLPGIEGGPWSMHWAQAAFRDAGVESEIRIFDWQRPLGTLDNLTDYEGNRRKAAGIAKRIAAYGWQHPGGAIDLVGYSGGGGLAVMVAEALPEGVHLRNVVLVQPALSPDYDLTAALSRIDGKLVNFYSPYDWLILGLGTRLFGTMDRREVASAGKESFDLQRAIRDPTLRAKVEQRAWELRMIADGHFGDHFSILSYWWNRRYVAPYLLSDHPEALAPQSQSTNFDSGTSVGLVLSRNCSGRASRTLRSQPSE